MTNNEGMDITTIPVYKKDRDRAKILSAILKTDYKGLFNFLIETFEKHADLQDKELVEEFIHRIKVVENVQK